MALFGRKESPREYASGKIPYLDICGDDGGIVENRDGMIFATYVLYGIDDRMRDKELEARCASAARFLSSGFNANYEITFDFVRLQKAANGRIDERISVSGELENAREVRSKRTAHLRGLYVYENVVYFSMAFLPYPIAGRTILTRDALDEFENNLRSCESSFGSFGFAYRRIRGDELYCYLYSTVSCNFFIRGLKVPQGRLHEALANEVGLTPSAYPLLIDDKRLLQMIALRSLPFETDAATLLPLLSVPFNIRAVFKIRPLSFQESEDRIYRRREEFARSIFRGTALFKRVLRGDQGGADEDEIDLSSQMGKQGCDMALLHKKEAGVSTADFSASIFLWSYVDRMDAEGLAECEKRIDEKHKYLVESLQNLRSLGVKLEKETKANTLAYLSSMPGSAVRFSAGRLHAMLDNIGDLLPLSSMQEEYRSPFLEEITQSREPLLIGVKPDRSAYAFSPFGSTEKGHTFVSAPTRAGKSILLALMANEWLKYANTRLVYVDIGLSCLKTIVGNNGKLYFPLGSKSGRGTAFQPFRNAHDNWEACISFMEAVSVANGFRISSDERNALEEVFRQLSEPFKGKETVTMVRKLMESRLSGGSGLTSSLMQYENQYGGLFNSSTDSLAEIGRVTGIELEEIMGESDVVKLPTLVYILNSVERQITYKEPTMIVLDEAWRFLDDGYFQGYIRNWLKTLAKKRAFVVMATQELNDLIKSDITSTILENSETRIFLANAGAEEEITREAYEKIGLSGDEIDIVSGLKPYWTYIKQDGRRTIAHFDRDVCLENLKSEDELKDEYR